MPFLELKLICAQASQPRVERALESVGALAMTLADAHADATDEQAIFEPSLGQTPLWRELTVTALFDANTSRELLLHALTSTDAGIDWSRAQFHEVADQQWERVWMDRFRPMRFGENLWIYPWNIEPPDDGAMVVRLDPGLAFGTGTHPTTALCLEWLDKAELRGKRVIDYGCGSGVLGIAACKLGAATVLGVDNDPQALAASAENAERNGVSAQYAFSLPDDDPALGARAEVLVANILAGPLAALAPRFAAMVEPGGALVLSGILDGQQNELLERYDEHFDHFATDSLDGWFRITATRR